MGEKVIDKETLLKYLKENYSGVPWRIDVWSGTLWRAGRLSGPTPEEEQEGGWEDEVEPYIPGEEASAYYERCCSICYGDWGWNVNENGDVLSSTSMVMTSEVLWETKLHRGRECLFGDSEESWGMERWTGCFKNTFNKYITPLLIAKYLKGELDINNIYEVHSPIPTLQVGVGIDSVITLWKEIIGGTVTTRCSPDPFAFSVACNRFELNSLQSEKYAEMVDSLIH